MIKIIKDGIMPKKYKIIYSTTCYKCMCEFEFEEEDCNTIFREKRPDGKAIALINCPCCNCDVSRDLKECNSRQEEVIEESKPEQILINPKVYDVWDNEHCNNCHIIGDACS